MADIAVPQSERVHVELDPAAILTAYAQHRRRFAAEVESLDETALGFRSRCSEWTVADVLRHCCDVDGWMQRLWSGQALPFSSFDPTKTPHEFVVARRSIADAEVRDRYVASAETMAADVESSGPDRWGNPSLSPLGFVPWWLSVLHIFYDSWLHERDVLLPLDSTVPVRFEEAVPVLAYSLVLVGTFIDEPTETVVAGVRLRTGESRVVATPVEPGCDGSDEVGSIIDALSGRGSLDAALSGADADTVHRLGGLARFFLAVSA